MKILLVEDDEDKARTVRDFLASEFKPSSLTLARSFSSGLRQLATQASDLDLVILDMSMPSFDVTPNEPTGGAPESFAGRDLLEQMKLRGIVVPTIVLTMLDSFGEAPNKVSLDQLIKKLKEEFGATFVGHVYYSTAVEGWKGPLRKLVREVVGDTH
jgi:CheY-like chemotaxis protein